MDGKIARQMLFKKKLEEENKEAEEKLRASWTSERADKDSSKKFQEAQRNESDGKATGQPVFKKKLEQENRDKGGKQNEFFRTKSKELETQVDEKQRLLSKKKKVILELEQIQSVKRGLQQEEAVQKMLEIKIHNNGIERANRLADIMRKMCTQTENLKIQEEQVTNAQHSMKLQRKIYTEIQTERTENESEETPENHENPSQSKKKTKTAKRLERETEQRRKILYERAEALKQKRAEKLKEEFENLKYSNSRKMDEIEKEKLSIEAKEREERKKHALELELIAKKLNNLEFKINDLELAITCMDLKLQEI